MSINRFSSLLGNLPSLRDLRYVHACARFEIICLGLAAEASHS